MKQMDPEGLQQFLAKMEKSTQDSGKFSDIEEFARLFQKTRINMMDGICLHKPWAMRLAIFIYKIRLRVHERRLSTIENSTQGEINNQNKHVESLRFAVQYGYYANAEQRTNCAQLIKNFRVPPFHAPFLVWANVINLRSNSIKFGHWDWICGICMLPAIAVNFFYALIFVLSPNLSSEMKTFLTVLYLVTGLGGFGYLKAFTLDAFRIGSLYFKPNGLSFTPICR